MSLQYLPPDASHFTFNVILYRPRFVIGADDELLLTGVYSYIEVFIHLVDFQPVGVLSRQVNSKRAALVSLREPPI